MAEPLLTLPLNFTFYGLGVLSSTIFLIPGSILSIYALALFFNNGICSSSLFAVEENL
jgi:hypothetical protein